MPGITWNTLFVPFHLTLISGGIFNIYKQEKVSIRELERVVEFLSQNIYSASLAN